MATAVASETMTPPEGKLLSDIEIAPLALVVDDSSMDRLLASRLVEKTMGWRVAGACNGVEALEAIKQERPAIVLTDMRMPEMDGLELVQEIRQNYPLIPVVLMTAHGSEEIAIEALQRGAASYIPKKNLGDYIAETLEKVLSSAKASRQQQYLLDCLTSADSQFVLENDPTLVAPLVSYLQDQLARFKLVDQNIHMRMGIALEETILNGIYHGNLQVSSELRQNGDDAYHQMARERARIQPYCDRRLRVHASLSRTQAVYVISDEGPGFDPSSLPDPTDPANLGKSSGRGLLLIRTFMDEVSFNGKGNQITLIKRRGKLSEKKPCKS
jgi:CheY-like chemotaxis protein